MSVKLQNNGFKVGQKVSIFCPNDRVKQGFISGFTTIGLYVSPDKNSLPHSGEWFSWSAFKVVRV